MSLIYFDDLQRKESETPIISDKILVDFVNSMQVNDDLISFRQERGLFGRFLDNLTGADRKRQIAIDKNVNLAMQSFHDLVLDISNNLNVSNNAIVTIEERLMEIEEKSIEIRDVIRNHREEINLLKDMVSQLQSRVENHDHRILSLQRSARQCGTIEKKLRGSNVPFIQRYSRKNC
jgi:DNA repair ATPase RecN